MSSPNIQARRFVPCKAETVVIGKTSVSLYLKVDPTMSNPKKALAYQQNCAVLAGADLDQRARILALAERLDLMLTVESSLADWERKLSKIWFNLPILQSSLGTMLAVESSSTQRLPTTPLFFCPCRTVLQLCVTQRVSNLFGFISGWIS